MHLLVQDGFDPLELADQNGHIAVSEYLEKAAKRIAKRESKAEQDKAEQDVNTDLEPQSADAEHGQELLQDEQEDRTQKPPDKNTQESKVVFAKPKSSPGSPAKKASLKTPAPNSAFAKALSKSPQKAAPKVSTTGKSKKVSEKSPSSKVPTAGKLKKVSEKSPSSATSSSSPKKAKNPVQSVAKSPVKKTMTLFNSKPENSTPNKTTPQNTTPLNTTPRSARKTWGVGTKITLAGQ